MWLAYFGYYEHFKYLLKAGASIIATSDHKYTALHAAAQKGHLEIVKHIIENKLLDIDCRGWCGSTPLHLAVQEGMYPTVCYLLQQGASITVTDSLGRTALHLAVWADNAELCSALLRAGADVNAYMNGGIAPIHLALRYRRVASIDPLVEYKAAISLLTDAGYSVAQCAEKGNNRDLLKLLVLAIRPREAKDSEIVHEV